MPESSTWTSLQNLIPAVFSRQQCSNSVTPRRPCVRFPLWVRFRQLTPWPGLPMYVNYPFVHTRAFVDCWSLSVLEFLKVER